jgi:hypothetical protein
MARQTVVRFGLPKIVHAPAFSDAVTICVSDTVMMLGATGCHVQ